MPKFYPKVFFCLLLMSNTSLFAQQYQGIMQAFLDNHLMQLGVEEAEVNNLRTMQEQYSKVSGLTPLYIRQRYAGIDVSNDLAFFAIKNKTVLSASVTVIQAATELRVQNLIETRFVQNTNTQAFLFALSNIYQDNIPKKIMYQVTDKNSLRLAWHVMIHTKDNKWWSLRIDALTVKIIDQKNWILSGSFTKCNNIYHPNNIAHINTNTDLNNLTKSAPLFALEVNLSPLDFMPAPPSLSDLSIWNIHGCS